MYPFAEQALQQPCNLIEWCIMAFLLLGLLALIEWKWKVVIQMICDECGEETDEVRVTPFGILCDDCKDLAYETGEETDY